MQRSICLPLTLVNWSLVFRIPADAANPSKTRGHNTSKQEECLDKKITDCFPSNCVACSSANRVMCTRKHTIGLPLCRQKHSLLTCRWCLRKDTPLCTYCVGRFWVRKCDLTLALHVEKVSLLKSHESMSVWKSPNQAEVLGLCFLAGVAMWRVQLPRLLQFSLI